MNVRYRITLSSEERAQLHLLVQGGQGPVRRVKRAQILLAAARGSRDERIAFQTDLKKLGFDPGDIDGVLGHKGRAATRAYQKSRNLPADGFATEQLLERIEQDIAAKGG